MEKTSSASVASGLVSPRRESISSATLGAAGAGSLGIATPAFAINFQAGIPHVSSHRRYAQSKECVDHLMNLKNPVATREKYDGDPKKRSLLPLNLNDLGNWDNMELMQSLRSEQDARLPDDGKSLSMATAANVHPPSFYEADVSRWRDKFKKAISDHKAKKSRYLSPQRQSMQMLDASHETEEGSKKYVGGGIQPRRSEYKRVASLRKSRGSTEGFVTLDLEGLTGNTAVYQGHIKKSSKDNLAHILSLRNYRNETNFNAQ